MANLSRACRNKCFAIRYVLHKLRYYEFRERVYFAERMRPTVRQVANFISEIRLTSKCGWRGCDGLTVKQFSLEMCTMFAEKILASIYLSGCLFVKTLLTFLSWIIFNFRRKSVFTVPVYIILINVAKTKPLDHIRLRGNCIFDTIDIFPTRELYCTQTSHIFIHASSDKSYYLLGLITQRRYKSYAASNHGNNFRFECEHTYGGLQERIQCILRAMQIISC